MTRFSTRRTLPATPEAVFAALADPARLARWWGPAGFANEFETFEFQPGGRWIFTMIGPDGSRYANASEFITIVPGRQLTLRHVCAPFFTLDIHLQACPEGCTLHWTQTLDDPVLAEQLRALIEPANEQNLDRLAAELARAA